MRSRKLITAYKAVRYWERGFHHALWYHARKVLTTDQQRNEIREAETLVIEAQKKLDSVFGPEIGKAIIAEVGS